MSKRLVRLTLLALALGTLGGCAENLTALYHPACFTSYSINPSRHGCDRPYVLRQNHGDEV
ncbi:MAG: hypothetical protein CL923_04400 [Deltaproteobacteria bacterium]|jgi:hypothetical protein|nr:hypothetical protein [Deltaproteobacteria bacterium]MBQ31783.1 hypothetical protein [Deltaproteobacteria bacterium]MDP7318084.1 hypothetical protein [SAR324 cluster bacterium]MDP7463020.1 hypothetical protein [SAR324 cluster bacterium]MDP7631203.1 hypothetical protein [SAR324 cluster bacterium]